MIRILLSQVDIHFYKLISREDSSGKEEAIKGKMRFDCRKLQALKVKDAKTKVNRQVTD
jgi:hypothetical protein